MTAEASPIARETPAFRRPRIEKLTLLIGCVACIAGALWMSRTLRIPGEAGRAGSVLQQLDWPIAMGIAWVTIIGGAVVSGVIASRVNYDAGLFCGCVGAAALSVQYGTMGFVMRTASRPGVFALCAVEILLLYVAVAIAWGLLRVGMKMRLLPAERIPFEEEPGEPLDQKLLAAAAHAVIMIVAMMLFSQSDAKMQALASVGISSYIAALAAHQLVPIRPSIWLILPPMGVGLIGYLMQWMHPGAWNIGDVSGFFAPLARVTPLDYASLGSAGALMGYWTSQQWRATPPEDPIDSLL